MRIVKCSLILLVSIFLIQCASVPEVKEVELPKSHSQYVEKKQQSTAYNDIDIATLIEELELNQSMEVLGYQERAFNSCEVKSNRSTQPYCQQLYLGRVNYQVMCRESTGTVEKVSLTPLHSQRLKWKSGHTRGLTQTNTSGFGQMGFIKNRSSATEYLFLYLGSKIALKRLNDKWKLILPKSWCTDQ